MVASTTELVNAGSRDLLDPRTVTAVDGTTSTMVGDLDETVEPVAWASRMPKPVNLPGVVDEKYKQPKGHNLFDTEDPREFIHYFDIFAAVRYAQVSST